MVSKALVVASYRSKLNELAALGVDITSVVPETWVDEGKPIAFESSEDDRTRIIVAPLAWNGHFHFHYYPTLGRIMKEVRPEILHMDEEPYNLATYLAFRHAAASGSRALFFAWQNIQRRYPLPFRLMERRAYRQASHAQAGNREAADILRAKGYRGGVAIIPQFGVDVERFVPAPHDDRPFTVGFLGRLVPEKGVADLLAAFLRLDPDSRLIVAGDGPMAALVNETRAEMNDPGRIEHYSRMPSSDMPNLYRRLDVVVLPSRTTKRWREQFGRVLIEGMASGVPVIGSDSGEIPNVVGDAGLIFPEGNVDKLTEVLRRLQESQELRTDLAERGRRHVVAEFSQRRIAEQTAEVYEEMMSIGREQ